MDVYSAVTERVIAQMEQGIIPWRKPWVGSADLALSHATGKPYSLLNQILLGEAGEFATFKQITDAGGHVKKGSKARLVVFWKILQGQQQDADGHPILDADGSPAKKQIPLLKAYNVFNLMSDVEGLPCKYYKPVELPTTHAERIAVAEQVFTGYIVRSGVKVNHERQGRAYYSPLTDSITLPIIEQFEDSSEYYSTAFHEAAHSTGHFTRLNRIGVTGIAAFGSEDYSKEELTAELSAAGILNSIGLETSSSFTNSAAYIQNWLKALRNDKRLLVGASQRAEKAIDLIMGDKRETDVLSAESELP